MGKRKRINGGKENEATNILGNGAEETQPECKKQCLNGDLTESVDALQSNVTSSSQLLELIESTNNNDELPATTTDARPTLQLRSSVRVQNKRKEENRCEASSETLMKKADPCSQDEDEEDTTVKPDSADAEGKKTRRPWEVWSMEYKDVFFEALNDCGKDFEAIQSLLMTKLRRKGNGNYAPKNKEQVRHFYYRTWHKIYKHVIFNKDVKKATQELYGLINYGELRRRVGGTLDEKKGQKLQELIERGSASFRKRGKSIRVRTPICRALKKLNQFSDEKDHGFFRVPSFITVTLSAGNIESWTKVQSLAHNPRVRIKCPLHKQLSSIFTLFKHKWRSQEVKMCEHLASLVALPVDVPSTDTSIIRLKPLPDVYIKMPSVQVDAPQMTSSAVSLASHEQYLENNMLKLTVATHRKARKRKTNKSTENRLEIDVDSQDDGSDGELDCRNKSPPSQGDLVMNDVQSMDHNPTCRSVSPVDITIGLSSASENCNTELPMDLEIKDEPDRSPMSVEVEQDGRQGPFIKEENDALRELMALQNIANPHDPDDDDVIFVGENTRLLAKIRDQVKTTDGQEIEVGTAVSDEEDLLEQEKMTNEEDLKNSVEQIRKGWTSSTCGSIKIGELFLMFGKKKTLFLEYTFEEALLSGEKSELEAVTSTSLTEITASKTPVETIASLVETLTDKSQLDNVANASQVEASISESQLENNASKSQIEAGSIKSPMETDASREQSIDLIEKSDNSCDHDSTTVPSEVESKKKIARSESSDILERLVVMVKSLGSKPAVGDCFFCGASKSSACIKSPSHSRNSSYGRSPGNTRSPRVPGSSKSPKNGMVHPKATDEKAKPTSAKRSLACIPEEKEESTGFNLSQAENLRLPAAVEQQIKPKISTDSSGRFRVPLAPAPRVNSSNIGFNAQLSKFLPKYSRPRMTTRKNMYVQRQLTLLPNTAKNNQRVITLKVLPTPEDGSSTFMQSVSTVPKMTKPVNHMESSVTVSTTSNSDSNSPISMPIISTATPTSAAISVNVSGQQLLSVQMPTFTAAPPCSVRLAEISDQADVAENALVPAGVVEPDRTLPVNDMVTNSDLNNDVSLSDFKEDIGVKVGVEDIRLTSDPLHLNTSLSQCAFELEKPAELSCSTPILPELSDISFLEVTPLNSPAKSKFSLSPLNCLSDSSNLSIFNSPKQLDGKSIKLNLSAILNSAAFSRLDVQEAAPSESGVPQIHIPEQMDDGLPLLDLSIGGTLSINQPQHANLVSSSDFDLKMASTPNKPSTSGNNEKVNVHTKLMDITLCNSNSNSSFSSLLSAVGHSAVEMEASETLQTPPRAERSQPSSVTKKDANAPFGLSFKANLFTSDYHTAAPTVSPSPPTSPSRLLQQSDNNSQWLNNEVNDLSLSTLLNNIESPIKSSNCHKLAIKEDSCSLSCFLSDNSVDFATTFAKFKAQIAKENNNE